MIACHGLDRRSFFKLAGGGIVVFVGLDPSALFSQDRQRIYPEDFNAYLLIGETGRATRRPSAPRYSHRASQGRTFS